jgi:hypothetical protein
VEKHGPILPAALPLSHCQTALALERGILATEPPLCCAEYAVTDGGGWGNVVGAVSEAAFMTGMERNGDVVTLGAYVSTACAACST